MIGVDGVMHLKFGEKKVGMVDLSGLSIRFGAEPVRFVVK